MGNPKLYTTTDAAEKIGCSRVTIHRWIQRGIVHPRRSEGGMRLLTTQDVTALRKQIKGK